MFEELASIFEENDSLPMGGFETRPCSNVMGGRSQHYPEIVELGLQIDADQLEKDFVSVRDQLSQSFIKDRLPYLVCSWESLQPYYEWLNVSGGVYKVLALRKLGEVEPLPIIPVYTRQLLAEGFGCGTFKQQYATTGPNYKLRHHIDYRNFMKLGYRVNIPINVDSVVAFTDDGINERRYNLLRGRAYFFNVGRFHRAENVQNRDRTNLVLQLSDDAIIAKSILEGRGVRPWETLKFRWARSRRCLLRKLEFVKRGKGLRNPWLVMFIFLHLGVMIGGAERYYWPFHAYHMFSRVEHLAVEPYLSVRAYDENKKQVHWDDGLGEIVSPIPSPASIHCIINKHKTDVVCRYLKSLLYRTNTITEFQVFKQDRLMASEYFVATIKKDTACESLVR